MINNTDKVIKETLYNKSKNLEAPDYLLNTIKNQVYNKEDTMKKHKFTARTILAASFLTIILVTGVIASGGLAYIQSSSDSRNAIDHYPTIEEVQREVNYVPKYPKALGKYEFYTAQPYKTNDMDETNNVINSYNDISFYYKTNKIARFLAIFLLLCLFKVKKLIFLDFEVNCGDRSKILKSLKNFC